MIPFINDNFLLENKSAEKLYHKFSENLPIIDFHCHLSPSMIAGDVRFENLSQAWLAGDHYKWRAMRTNGISEEYCTGNASDREKFIKWAGTVPATLGNPLYHWTHLELARYFNIKKLLSSSTASEIYEQASGMLKTEEFSVRSLIRRMKVEVLCTTDDPADSLEHHAVIRRSFEVIVLPTFRPDAVIKTEDPEKFSIYIDMLGNSAGIKIRNLDSLLEALDIRHKYFHDNGCRLSDHGLDRFYFSNYKTSEINNSLGILLKRKPISSEAAEKYKTALLSELCRMNHKRGWVQQFHMGALRNNNTRMFRIMGPDTGWDSIGGSPDPVKISRFLSSLDDADRLAKTILYNLNPADNEMMITMAANFNDGTSPGKVQYGAAWWFLDQKNGIEKNLSDVASLGLLSRFVGMVTDSRSFLSYPRHEYFRRLACNYVGNEVRKGIIPDDEELLIPLIEGISYRNAKEYFGF
jgi:glucuronate isomerase